MNMYICDRCGKAVEQCNKFKIKNRNTDLCNDCKNDLFLFLFGYELEGVKIYTPTDGSYLKVLYDTMYNPNTNEIEEG